MEPLEIILTSTPNLTLAMDPIPTIYECISPSDSLPADMVAQSCYNITVDFTPLVSAVANSLIAGLNTIFIVSLVIILCTSTILIVFVLSYVRFKERHPRMKFMGFVP